MTGEISLVTAKFGEYELPIIINLNKY